MASITVMTLTSKKITSIWRSRDASSAEASEAQDALACAFREHAPLMRAIALSILPNRAMIDDVLQQAFAKVYAAGATATIKNPKAYLVTAVRNVAIEFATSIGKNRSTPIDELSDFEVLSGEPSLETVIQDDQQVALLAAAIKDLPPKCRQVLIMNRVEGYSLDEVADGLGISKSTVHKHLAKGVLRCSEYLAEHGYDRRGRKSDRG